MEDVHGKRPIPQLDDPSQPRSSLRQIGPGLAMAATSVGTGDLITTLVAGSRYGLTLMWAVVAAVAVKYFCNEAIGRYYLATGRSMVEGWWHLGRPVICYFMTYFLIASFIVGAATPAVSGLTMHGMVPGLSTTAWAVLHAVLSVVLLYVGRYGLFEKAMELLIGLMFVTIVLLAILLVDDLGTVLATAVPDIPQGDVIGTLAIIGGIGGTFSLVFYPYWIGQRKWQGSKWLRVMTTDVIVGYIVIAVFVIAMMLVGAAVLFGAGLTFDEDILTVADPIGERFGLLAKWLFLLGAWAAATSSLLGAYNGAAHIFADFVRLFRRAPDEAKAAYLDEKNVWFRGYVAFMAFPPMTLLLLGKPVALVIAYTALGSVFLPFLAATLMWLLTGDRVPARFRNGPLANIGLTVSLLLFVGLGIVSIRAIFG